MGGDEHHQSMRLRYEVEERWLVVVLRRDGW